MLSIKYHKLKFKLEKMIFLEGLFDPVEYSY